MIRIRRSDDRGHANHGWLDTYHTFSFAGYHDPEHTHFGPLRVLNQDFVAPGKGFGTHPHDNMEIVTYVVSGVLEHKDSMGTGSQIRPGEVQLMSAGTGVTHSEFNGSADEPVHLLQMWIFPRRHGFAPRYEQKAFPDDERRNALRLVVSPDGAEGSLMIGQSAWLRVGTLDPGARVERDLEAREGAWLHVARGRVRIGGDELGPGDGAAITEEATLALEAVGEEAEVLMWEFGGA